jgi:hypothetical protein
MTREAFQIGTSRVYVPSQVQVFPSILFEDVLLVPKHREPAVFYLGCRPIFQKPGNNGPPVAYSELLFKDYPIFICTASAILTVALPDLFRDVFIAEPTDVRHD